MIKLKARVRCWRLVVTEHMVKLLISVGLLDEAGTNEVTQELEGWDVALWFAVGDTKAVV